MPFEIRAPKKKSKKKKQSPCLMITSLPDDIIVDIFARVSIWDIRTLSVVSKHFRTLVSSLELHARRSLLGYTEACIYSVFKNIDYKYYLYAFRPKGNKSSFVRVRKLPDVDSDSRFLSVGSRIYVLTRRLNRSYSIDCISHILKPISNIRVPMSRMIAQVIDKKIYVVGNDAKNVIVVFNTETQVWEPKMTIKIKPSIELGHLSYDSVVMADKIYMKDSHNSFVYEPKEGKWETDTMLNSYAWKRSCVLDNVLYYFSCDGKKLRAYDSKQKCWKEVKGLEDFLQGADSPWWSHIVSYNGKLVAFMVKINGLAILREIWCAEIAIERRQGEIWGKVKQRNVVLTGNFYPEKSLVVMV